MRTALLVSVALYGLGSARLTNWKPKGHNWEPKGHEWSPATPWDSKSFGSLPDIYKKLTVHHRSVAMPWP
jgi:hypothetical protein